MYLKKIIIFNILRDYNVVIHKDVKRYTNAFYTLPNFLVLRY